MPSPFFPGGLCHHPKTWVLHGKAWAERATAARNLLGNAVEGAIVIPLLGKGVLGILKGKAFRNRVLSLIVTTRRMTTVRVPVGRAVTDSVIEFSSLPFGNRHRMCGGGSVLHSGPGYTIGGVMIGS